MRFKFAFETLMKDRRVRKDEAQRDFRLALSKVNEEKINLQHLRNELRDAIASVQITREQGGKLTGALVALEEFITGQKVRIQNKIRLVKSLEDQAEQKREVLVEAMKEVKILEKLREKRYNTFKTERRKREQRELDEVSIILNNRGATE